MVALQTAALSSALAALDVKPEIIDQVVSTLTSTSGDLGGEQLTTDGAIAPASFGHRPSATNLSTHYDKALEFTQGVVDQLVENLNDFATNAKTAITYVQDTDGQSAAQLARARAAVDDLRTTADNTNDGTGR